MATEFEIIRRYFHTRPCADVRLGIGDDAAIVAPAPGTELALAVDTLVDGVHFPSGTQPRAVGYRALAVNLSDLAAMGARPRWALLALTLPTADEAWLAEFAAGFADLAGEHDVRLVGGDTTRGPLAVTVSLCGELPAGQALRRSGAKPGDRIYVSGRPGAAAAGLACVQRDLPAGPATGTLREAFVHPRPRIALGRGLLPHASAAIDISDGLAADLLHVLQASGAGATLETGALPLAAAAVELFGAEEARRLALHGGDDYELCFTVPEAEAAAAERIAAQTDVPVACIGRIESAPGLRCRDAQGRALDISAGGYDHFRAEPDG